MATVEATGRRESSRPVTRGRDSTPYRTLGPGTTRFFAANLRHIQGTSVGQPFAVDDWQQEDIDLMLQIDERGRPVWREILVGWTRGMGKSPTASGLALTTLATATDKPKIFVGSGAKEQAKIVGEYVREMAAVGPLKDWTRPIVGGVKWNRPGGGYIATVSAEGTLQHGKFPRRLILDELHVFRTMNQLELYNAFQSALHKHPYSQMFGITTAGWDKQSLLGELYDTMLKAPDVERSGPMGCRLVCKDRAAGRLMIWRGAPDDADPHDPAVWRASNPASWIEPEEIARLALTMPLAVFRRLHLNQWTESSESQVRPEAWAACAVERLDRGSDTVLAWSASPRRDQAALVAVSTVGERVGIRLVRSWSDSDQGVIEDEMAEAVAGEVSAGAISCFAADPLQLPEAYAAVQALGVSEYRGVRANRPGMPQTPAFMEPATSEFAAAIESGRLAHDGDVELRRMVLRVEAADTRRGWMIARPKRSGDRKPESVEGALAAAMGVYAASVKRSKPQFEVWD